MKKYSLQSLSLLVALALVIINMGCSRNTPSNTAANSAISSANIAGFTTTIASNYPGTSIAMPTTDYASIAHRFLEQKNFKIVVNSVAVDDIQLPSDFSAVIGGFSIGDFLKQRNELSKQNNLDFSSYMGQKVKIYAAQIDTGERMSNFDIIILIYNNNIIGYWIDAGLKDPIQKRLDLNVIVNLLKAR